MKRITALIISILILLLSGCSSNLQIAEKANFKPEKVKLNLQDNQALLNNDLSENILTSVGDKNDLFYTEEIKINKDLNAERFALVDQDIYLTAFDYIKGQVGLYLFNNNQCIKLYEASDTIDIIDLLSKDGKIYFVEQYDNYYVLKCYSPSEKSIKKIIEIYDGKYYSIYDCGNYIAFATTEDNITDILFINDNNGKHFEKSFEHIDICPTYFIDNNYFAYRDIGTGSIVFFDIDNNTVVATVSPSTSSDNSFDKATIIRDNVILSDGFGIYKHSLSNNKTYLVYSRAKIEWDSNLPFYLVGNTVLFFDDSEVLCAISCDKNKYVEISTDVKVYCTNSVNTFIFQDDSGNFLKYILK